jgi:hypothetical protein
MIFWILFESKQLVTIKEENRQKSEFYLESDRFLEESVINAALIVEIRNGDRL